METLIRGPLFRIRSGQRESDVGERISLRLRESTFGDANTG
jgi:hypothetical protein